MRCYNIGKIIYYLPIIIKYKRSLLNVALGRLGTFIKYKANDYGKAVVEVNPAYTSKTCHICQGRNTIRANQATLICLNGCGTFNADENAAIVIA